MTLQPLTAFCYGIACAGALSAGMFFYRFWRLSGDRFFLWFSGAFALLAIQWVALVGAQPDAESRPYYYLPRLTAFLFIIAAVVQKNRRPEAGPAQHPDT
jgi:hypothetical protein